MPPVFSSDETPSNSGAQVQGHQPLPLNDSRFAWIVESGSLDVLLSVVHEDRIGARRQVLRAGAGQVVFGMASDGGARSELLGIPSVNTQLRRVEWQRLQTPEAFAETNLSAVELLESWVNLISEAVVPDIAPKGHSWLRHGLKLKFAPGEQILGARTLLWIRHLEGASQICGYPGVLPVGKNQLFPLSPAAWMVALIDSQIEVFDTPGYLKEEPDWASLRAFHEVIYSALAFRHIVLEEREAERLEKKHHIDRRLVASSILKLSEPLARDAAQSGVPRDAAVDPLLNACQAVGRSLGLEMRALASSKSVSSSDPVLDIARASNVRARRILLRGIWWKSDHGALVGFRQETKNPVALLPTKTGHYQIYDPENDSVERVNSKIAETLELQAFSFYRPLPAKAIQPKDLIEFAIQLAGTEVWTVLLTGIAGGLLGLLIPIVTGELFDTAIPGAQRPQVIAFTILLVVGALATGMFELTRSLALLRFEGRVGASLQAAVWDRLLALPVPFFRQYSAGDLADRANGIDGIRSVLTGTVTNSIVSGIFSVFNLGLMFYYSWKLSVVAVGLVVITFGATMTVGFLQIRKLRILTLVAGRLSGTLLQFINGIAKFRVSGTENRAFSSWAEGFSSQKSLSKTVREYSNYFTVFNSFFFIFGPMAIFFAVYQWTGRIQTGEFLAFNAAFGQMFLAAMTFAGAVISMMSLVPSYERATPILHAVPEVLRSKGNPGELTGILEVNHVAFRYKPESPLVLKDISFRVEAGQFVALVGPSGCGKSTIFRLLLGFDVPEAGGVYYDGQDLTTVDLQAVRRQMGVVLQNSTLFRGDIVSNIIGSKRLTIDDAWEAARLSGFDQDIENMPMGMHTIIGEGGGGISGGQRQRLMIARAIVSKPRILLFDEATSALDNHTQSIVSRSLDALKATRIVIAHRLSTIMNADKILVLDDGQIVQQGTYAELLDQPGLFAELIKRQLT